MTERLTWQVRLLGLPALNHDPEPLPLDRKLSATLAYLALEGPTSRSRLSSLLWPNSGGAGALNNLAQALRRVRATHVAQVIQGREILQLDPGIRVDAPQVRAWYRSGQFGAFLEAFEPLLAPFDFDDCPEFEEWLLAERDTWREWQVTAVTTLAQEAERAGDLQRALSHAVQLLQTDPAVEGHYVHVMRLQAALGRRAQALETWDACQLMLQRSYGVSPLPDSAAIARQILDGQAATTAAAPEIPISVLRPPVLIGREAEWTQMVEAWQKHQGVCLIGEPGVGKSRLIQEFARAHGGSFYFECRPGDEYVPFGLTVRMLRRILQQYPDLSFEPWVTAQLARILPEFGPSPAPLTSQADKVQFYQALTEVLRGAVQAGLTVLAYDDTHHFDDSSAEAQLFMWGALGWGDPDAPFRIVFNSRPQEYSSLAAQSLADLVHTGRVHVIELRPLPPDAAQQLVNSLRVPGLDELAGDLYRYTGGNPQYLLETVKHLIETGQTLPDARAPFTPPVSTAAVLSRRLQQLSPAALHAAQAAATLQSDFTLEIVARTLRQPLLSVLPAWQELERAQMITGGRFSHDLVYEAALASLSETERAALHRSAARVLDQQGAQPARLARHWLGGGERVRAAEQFVAASTQARSAMRLEEAAAFLEQAADLYAQAGRQEEAFAARLSYTRDLLKEFDLGGRFDRSLSTLFEWASSDAQRAQAWHCQGLLHSRRQELHAAREAAQTGWALAERSGDAGVTAELAQFLGVVALQENRLGEATRALEQAARLNSQLGRVAGERSALQNLGVALAKQGRYLEATQHLETLIDRLGAADPVALLNARSNLGLSLARLGRKREARAQLLDVLARLDQVQGREMNRMLALVALGALERDLGWYTSALDRFRAARAASEAYGRFGWPLALSQAASVYASIGAAAEARALAQEALAAANLSVAEQVDATIQLARAQRLLHEDPRGTLESAAALGARLAPEDELRLDLMRARFSVKESARVLTLIRNSQARELLPVAEAVQARHLLTLGQPEEAAVHAARATQLLMEITPLESPRPVLLAVHAAALRATGHPDARTLETEVEEALAAAQLPEGHMQKFLAGVRNLELL